MHDLVYNEAREVGLNIDANKALIEQALQQKAGEKLFVKADGLLIYPRSVHRLPSGTTTLVVEAQCRFYLLEFSSSRGFRFLGDGKSRALRKWNGGEISILPLTTPLVEELAEQLSWIRPVPVGTEKPSFGWGNRTLLSSVAVLDLFREWEYRDRFNIVTIQQSSRENEVLARLLGFRDVMASGMLAKLITGYTGRTGSDADHLKTSMELDEAVTAGFTGYTIDPSTVLRQTPGAYAEGELTIEEIASLGELERLYRNSVRRNDLRGCLDRILKLLESRFAELSSGDRVHDRRLVMAGIVKFGDAISFMRECYGHLKENLAEPFDFEPSFDETETPTDALAHLLIASELLHWGVRVTRFAVRFVGRFEKARDYGGDREEFIKDFRRHKSIADSLGYLLSVHSGSGKYGIYPYLEGVHLKTSGDISRPLIVALAKTNYELYSALHSHLLRSARKTKKLYGAVSSAGEEFGDVPEDISELRREEVVNKLESDVNWKEMSHYGYGVFTCAEGVFGYSSFEHREKYLEEITKVVVAHRDAIAEANLG